MIYLAAPVLRNDQLFGVLYLSTPLAALERALARMRVWLLAAGLVTAVLAVPLAWCAVRDIGRPLDQIRQAALRLAAAQWSARVAVPDPQELAELAEAFNRMADQLQERIGVMIQNNNEQKAVLASMAEGVLALDSQERVISMNAASGRLLGLDQSQAQGRRLREVVRNADLSRFISLCCPARNRSKPTWNCWATASA